ncbi:hypothetical protein P3S68_002481 [Capsicum galapagoense]
MRDFASCSSYSNTSCFPQNSSNTLSTQNNVTCLYRVILSNKKQFLITVSWSKTNVSQSLYIQFDDNPSNSFKLSANSRIFKKKKGSKAIEFDDDHTKVEVFWDLCEARYNHNMSSPEPIDKYYVVVTFGSELGLILGDIDETKFKNCNGIAKFSLISRQEHFLGNTHYSTKAKFCGNGSKHDILISCHHHDHAHNSPVLSVCIDKKMVIRVKRLQWNFRGNQSIYLDGLFVDLMWDVHDWFFNTTNSSSSSCCGVFMFRTRSGLESSRLWLEEDKDKLLMHKNQDKAEFSFIIYACKST